MFADIHKNLAMQIVEAVREVCGLHINFINASGIVFASTDSARIGCFHEVGYHAFQMGSMIEVTEDDPASGVYRGVNLPVYHEGLVIAVIGISGSPEDAVKYAHLAERITRLLIREQELNHDRRISSEKKSALIRLLSSESYANPEFLRSSLMELRIHPDRALRMLLIRFRTAGAPGCEGSLDQGVLRLFDSAGIRLYAYRYPDEYAAVAEDGLIQDTMPLFQKFAKEYGGSLCIGIGSAEPLVCIFRSFKTAQTALKSASAGTSALAVYEDLTLELLLGNVEPDIQAEYQRKVLRGLSQEDLSLLRVYYEEDMSLTATGRRLFMHKNTLQYKLDRIYRLCGLNPRRFQDALLICLGLKLT